VLNFITIGQVL